MAFLVLVNYSVIYEPPLTPFIYSVVSSREVRLPASTEASKIGSFLPLARERRNILVSANRFLISNESDPFKDAAQSESN